MFRTRGVSLCTFAVACGCFAVAGTVAAQETVDVAPASREILEALQRALRPSNQLVAPPDQPRYPLRYDEAPPPAPVEVEETSVPAGRPLARIEYEVSIIHLAAPGDFEEEETSVSSETLPGLLEAWREAGRIARRSTFRFASLDDSQASVQVGEQVPVATGRTSFGGGGFGGGRGPSQTSVTYHDVGTIVGCTGRIEGSDIVVEVQIEESRLEPAGTLPALTPPGPSDESGAVAAQAPAEDLQLQSTKQLRTQTTTVVPDGGTVVLSATFRKTEEGAKGIIVTLKASTAQ